MDATTTTSTLTVSVERVPTLSYSQRELVLYYSQRANTLTHRESAGGDVDRGTTVTLVAKYEVLLRSSLVQYREYCGVG